MLQALGPGLPIGLVAGGQPVEESGQTIRPQLHHRAVGGPLGEVTAFGIGERAAGDQKCLEATLNVGGDRRAPGQALTLLRHLVENDRQANPGFAAHAVVGRLRQVAGGEARLNRQRAQPSGEADDDRRFAERPHRLPLGHQPTGRDGGQRKHGDNAPDDEGSHAAAGLGARVGGGHCCLECQAFCLDETRFGRKRQSIIETRGGNRPWPDD